MFDSYACLVIFVLLPIRKTIGVFAFAWIILFADSTSRLYWLPFHLGSWDIGLMVRPIANCLRGSSPVMEALRSTHWNVESELLLFDWGGYVNEVWDTVDTTAWLARALLWTSSTTLRLLGSWKLRILSLFYFLLFRMNGSWLDVLDRLWSSVAGGLFCTSVSACWSI